MACDADRLLTLLNEWGPTLAYDIVQEDNIDIVQLGRITVLSVWITIHRPDDPDRHDPIWKRQHFYPIQQSVDVSKAIADHAPLLAISSEEDLCTVTIARYADGPQTENQIRIGVKHDLSLLHNLQEKTILVRDHTQTLADLQPIQL